MPYYDLLGISPDFFEREAGIEADDIIDRSQTRIFTAVNQISRNRKLGEIYLDELAALPNVRIVTHLNRHPAPAAARVPSSRSSMAPRAWQPAGPCAPAHA